MGKPEKLPHNKYVNINFQLTILLVSEFFINNLRTEVSEYKIQMGL